MKINQGNYKQVSVIFTLFDTHASLYLFSRISLQHNINIIEAMKRNTVQPNRLSNLKCAHVMKGNLNLGHFKTKL